MQTHTLLLAGAGDLGQRTAKEFLAQGGKAIGLRRNPPKHNDGIQWLSADLTQAHSLTGLPDHITHVLYAPAPGERSETAYTNLFLHGLRNLLAALPRPPERLVFVSSSAVYGPSNAFANETSSTEPTRFNGKVLLEAEQFLKHALPQAHQAVTLRLSGIYGPGRLELLNRIRQGQARVPAHGTHWANRIHIEDATRVCMHLLTLHKPAPCYIGTDNHPYPIDELYDKLADMMQVPHPARSTEFPPTSGRRLENRLLRDSGFVFQWPDALLGYEKAWTP